jgi:hypothetical protein
MLNHPSCCTNWRISLLSFEFIIAVSRKLRLFWDMAPCQLEMVASIFRVRVFQEGPFKPWWWREQAHGRASNCFTIAIFDKYINFSKICYSISKVCTKWSLRCSCLQAIGTALSLLTFGNWKYELYVAWRLDTF